MFKVLPALLACLGEILFSAASSAQNTPGPLAAPAATQRHKVQVSDPSVGQEIVAKGGRLLADYGSFQLYETAEAMANPRVEPRDEYDIITLNAGHLNTRKAGIQALRKTVGGFSGKRMHLVQFVGPVQPGWRKELENAGARIVAYIPQNTYLVYGDAQSIGQIQKLAATAPHIQWEGAYLDAYKIHPLARATDAKGRPRKIGTDMFSVQLAADAAANEKTLQLLDRLKLEPLRRQATVLQYVNVVAKLAPESITMIAGQPEVVSIQPYFPRVKWDERQDQIIAGNLSSNTPAGPGYLSWLAGKGFNPAQFTNFAVDITDSGVDNGTTSPNHFGFYVNGQTTNASRVIYNRLEGSPNGGSTLAGCDGHGTLNSHVIGGYDALAGFPFADAGGFHYGLGVCPFVQIGSSVIFDPDNFTFPDFNTLQSDAYASGARISNNSWGAGGSSGAYDTESQNYDALVRDAQPLNDGNQEMVIVFAAGNEGPGPQTVSSPGTGKNLITVGASDNVQAFGGSDRGGIGDNEASSANEIASFSSRGPCADGRRKPDIVAPGTHVSGGVIQAANPGTNGTADACFTGDGVDGGPNGSIFFPAGQQFYTASSGTSHSTPCVVGGCALLRQYFINLSSNPPSPAMTKAYLVNSARYLNGASADDTLWSGQQGMGEMNLGTAFDGTPRILRDQLPTDLFTASGQTRTFTGAIANTNKPLRVTIVWTDAPGSTTGNAWNNDLDLTVSAGGNTYKGNVFSGAFSTSGGVADTQNNVESVFLPAGISGGIVAKVTASSINSIGVPNSNNVPQQDFALVVYNASTAALPVISQAGSSLLAENCFPTNGAIDPGETVTVSFALQNLGTQDASNLVATLQPNTAVLSPSGPQTYGMLAAGGAVVSRSFTFTAAGVCGGTITATLALQNGSNSLGTIPFSFQLGLSVPITPLAENFDGVTAPALPTGWTSSASGAGSGWMTSASAADTAPNAAMVMDVDAIGVSELTTPAIPIISSSAQLTFRNNYDLEADPPGDPSPVVAFDGGVLEIQIGGGAFTDIEAAGGSFVSGGYTTTIDPGDDNPLDGRSVWSGSSGGFITTVVNLPAAAAGQNIRLKWRCATDTANGFGGSAWFIDTVSVLDSNFVCCQSVVAPTILNPRVVGTNIIFSFQTVNGQGYTVQSKSALSSSGWTPVHSLSGDGSIKSVTNALSGPQHFYRISSP